MPDAARWLLALLLLAHTPLASAASVDVEVRERGGAAVAGLPVRLLGVDVFDVHHFSLKE